MDLRDAAAPPGATNGSGPPPDEDPPRPPARAAGPSLRPALIVLGLAVGILVVFGIFAGFTTVANAPSTTPTPPRSVPGTSLRSVGAARLLRPIELSGAPPANIVDAITIPSGAVALGHLNLGVDQYDQEMRFRVAGSQGAVVQFYRAEMRRLGWGQMSSGPARNQPRTVEVLGQKAGDDGWYWEMGAVVSPTTFPAGSPAGGTTFAIRLFQVSDTA
ncbi:MAG TPA: hypothetical protein VKG43_11345 [Acidimicrobiales bacterium]|nr:hypothetical protein [Acidimicrobiales bacterium]